jgi:hypothetical protein
MSNLNVGGDDDDDFDERFLDVGRGAVNVNMEAEAGDNWSGWLGDVVVDEVDEEVFSGVSLLLVPTPR